MNVLRGQPAWFATAGRLADRGIDQSRLDTDLQMLAQSDTVPLRIAAANSLRRLGRVDEAARLLAVRAVADALTRSDAPVGALTRAFIRASALPPNRYGLLLYAGTPFTCPVAAAQAQLATRPENFSARLDAASAALVTHARARLRAAAADERLTDQLSEQARESLRALADGELDRIAASIATSTQMHHELLRSLRRQDLLSESRSCALQQLGAVSHDETLALLGRVINDCLAWEDALDEFVLGRCCA